MANGYSKQIQEQIKAAAEGTIFIKRNNGITCGAKHLFHGFRFVRIDLTAEVMNCNFFQFFCSCLLFLY